MRWVLVIFSLGTTAHAEVPLPSYETHLGITEWLTVNEHIEQAGYLRAQANPQQNASQATELQRQANAELRLAIDKAQAYEAVVTQTSGLAYMQGLSWRLLNNDAKAEAQWRRSIALDPVGAIDAYHDLGELLISQQHWTEADEAFSKVSAHLTVGTQAWRGPLRQAEVAGWTRNDRALETHLSEAIRRGYNMGWIRNEPQWRTFYADPKLRRTVEKMVIIYADRDLLKTLEPK